MDVFSGFLLRVVSYLGQKKATVCGKVDLHVGHMASTRITR